MHVESAWRSTIEAIFKDSFNSFPLVKLKSAAAIVVTIMTMVLAKLMVIVM